MLTGNDSGPCDCYTLVDSEDDDSGKEGTGCMLDFEIEDKGENLSFGER